MYVNAANPAIRALSECDEPRRRRALGLLAPLAELLGGTQGGAGLENALKSFEASVLDIVRNH
jgi:hypothetical protein